MTLPAPTLPCLTSGPYLLATTCTSDRTSPSPFAHCPDSWLCLEVPVKLASLSSP